MYRITGTLIFLWRLLWRVIKNLLMALIIVIGFFVAFVFITAKYWVVDVFIQYFKTVHEEMAGFITGLKSRINFK